MGDPINGGVARTARRETVGTARVWTVTVHAGTTAESTGSSSGPASATAHTRWRVAAETRLRRRGNAAAATPSTRTDFTRSQITITPPPLLAGRVAASLSVAGIPPA